MSWKAVPSERPYSAAASMSSSDAPAISAPSCAAASNSLAVFERIDRITNLCDKIAFDFCFEAPAEGEVHIFPRNDRDDEVAVQYRIEDGSIEVAPWPFEVDGNTGYLVGYQLDGYPAVLEPVTLPYRLGQVVHHML